MRLLPLLVDLVGISSVLAAIKRVAKLGRYTLLKRHFWYLHHEFGRSANSTIIELATERVPSSTLRFLCLQIFAIGDIALDLFIDLASRSSFFRPTVPLLPPFLESTTTTPHQPLVACGTLSNQQHGSYHEFNDAKKQQKRLNKNVDLQQENEIEHQMLLQYQDLCQQQYMNENGRRTRGSSRRVSSEGPPEIVFTSPMSRTHFRSRGRSDVPISYTSRTNR